MKKQIYLYFALIVLVLGATKAHAQTLGTPYFAGSCYASGDSILMSTLGTATGSETLEIYYGDGTSSVYPPTFFSGGTDYFDITHAYATSGSYTVKFVLISGGVDIDSVITITNFIQCQAVNLKFYNDVNNNCTFDAGDIAFFFEPVSIEVDSAGHTIDTLTTTWGGDYLTFAPLGTAYVFKVIDTPYGLKITCAGAGTINHTVSSGTASYSVPFACNTSAPDDNAVYAYSGDMAVHNGWQWTEVTTSSCTGTPLTLTITYSPKYSVAHISPWSGSGATYSVAGNIITVNFPSVSSATPTGVDVDYTAVASLSIGDTVHSMFQVTPIAGDPYPANNTETFVDSIRTAYDPNGKSVQPEGNITAGTNLQYMVSFENTGNDTAFNIVVRDTLSDNVDVKSIKQIAASAAVEMSLFTYAGHNVAQFSFPNINLLDSSHHGQCEGFVTFTINAKSGLANGTAIDNKAGIYFDDNPVVMTNNVENLIGRPASVSVLTNLTQVEIYPNPANDELTIKLDNGAYSTMNITNTLGQVLMRGQLNGAQTKISVKTLPSGIYYITLRGDSGVKVQKFEKL